MMHYLASFLWEGSFRPWEWFYLLFNPQYMWVLFGVSQHCLITLKPFSDCYWVHTLGGWPSRLTCRSELWSCLPEPQDQIPVVEDWWTILVADPEPATSLLSGSGWPSLSFLSRSARPFISAEWVKFDLWPKFEDVCTEGTQLVIHWKSELIIPNKCS